MHAGAILLSALVRQRFWAIKGSNLARCMVWNCIAWFKNRPRLATQIIGSHPQSRVQAGCHPFELASTLPDLSEFSITFEESSLSRYTYLCVTVCLPTKRCHLKLVSKRCTNAFLWALNEVYNSDPLQPSRSPIPFYPTTVPHFIGNAYHNQYSP